MSAPTLTTYLDASPCPRVEVFFSSFAAGTASATVYRLAEGREYQVRGAVNAPTAGSLTRIDFEVPFNVPVTYRAEQFNAAGLSLGFTAAAVVTVASVDTWAHNPLDPQGSVKVELWDTALRRLSRPVPGGVSYPRGRRVGVVVSEPRRRLSGVVFDLLAETIVEADKIQALIGDDATSRVPVLCIRAGSRHRMRPKMPLFLGVFDIPEDDLLVRHGGEATVQRIEGDEVDPPIPGLQVSLLTAADINAYYPTAAAANADNLTGAALNRRYDLAGYA